MATDQSLEMAQRLMMRGRMAEAERIYRELLGAEPENLSVLEGLGVVLYQQNRGEEAAAVFCAGWHANRNRFVFRLTWERPCARLASSTRPWLTSSRPWRSLPRTYRRGTAWAWSRSPWAGTTSPNTLFARPFAMIRVTRAPRSTSPTRYWLWDGRPRRATHCAALRNEPGNPMALTSLAALLADTRDQKDLAEAETLGRRAVALSPRSGKALATLARVLRLQGRTDDALEYEARARRLQPGGAAGAPALPVATIAPENSQAQDQYAQGVALLADGRTDEAETCLSAAIRLDATLASAWVALATVHAERGDITRSCDLARTALTLAPNLAEAYWRLATNLLGRLPDHEVRAMEGLLADESLSGDDRALLHFGLAAVLDRRGCMPGRPRCSKPPTSINPAANFARGLGFDPDQHSAFIDKMIATCTTRVPRSRRGWGEPDPRPVFVVGFPRSGTTLTEQILASHPRITGAGELPDLQAHF